MTIPEAEEKEEKDIKKTPKKTKKSMRYNSTKNSSGNNKTEKSGIINIQVENDQKPRRKQFKIRKTRIKQSRKSLSPEKNTQR